MKIITTTGNWHIDKLYKLLQLKLNVLFKEARQMDIYFNIITDGKTIEINQPEYYEGFLFKITAEADKLYVDKSEHYVDDVNQLTLQSIIETLRMDAAEGADIGYISGE